MKLAEALIERADAQKRLGQLKQRLHANLSVQEGDDPAEDPTALIAEYEQVSSRLTEIVQKINRTNHQTAFDGNETLTEALARRDALQRIEGLFREAGKPSGQSVRWSRSEIKMVSTVDVTAMQQRADETARQYRELDSRIQATNWTTDLIE